MDAAAQDRLEKLRGIKPEPFYLLFVMYLLGLRSPATCATSEAIAAGAGWYRTTASGHLENLATLGYVHRLNYRAWCLAPKGLALFASESGESQLSGGGGSGLMQQLAFNKESINQLALTTTTGAESGESQLSGKHKPAQPEALVKVLLGFGASQEKAEDALRRARARGDDDETILQRIHEAEAYLSFTKWKPRQPAGFWIASVVGDARAIKLPEQDAPQGEKDRDARAEEALKRYDGYTEIADNYAAPGEKKKRPTRAPKRASAPPPDVAMDLFRQAQALDELKQQTQEATKGN